MNFRITLLCVAAGLAGLPVRAGTSTYALAYYNLAGAADGEKVSTMVASIDASAGYACRLSDRKADSWRAVPEGTEPGQWLSLVKVKFGQQCDFLLFRFADRNGTVAYAGRRPSRVREVKYYYSVPPGPGQIPENAIRETATDFVFRQSNETAVARPPLSIRVEPWPEGGAVDGGAGGASLQPAVLEAMAFAAAYEAGWQPTAGDAPVTIGLSAREEMGIFVAVSGRKPNQEPAFFRRNIPRESLYNHLARLFFRLRVPGAILESTACGSPESTLAAWKGGRVVLAGGEEGLRATELGTGRSSGAVSNELIAADSGLIVEHGTIIRAAREGWRFDAGEQLLAPPEKRDGRVLVLAKNNVVTLLDAATGKVLASRTWPTWLLGGCWAPGRDGVEVAVIDLRRRLTFLETPSLASGSEVAFPWDLKGPLLFAEGVPSSWPLQAAEEPEGIVPEIESASAAGPALLVRDRDGFLYSVCPTGRRAP